MSALAVRSARVTRDRGRSDPQWDITLLEQAHATAELRVARLDDVDAESRAEGSNDRGRLVRTAVEVFVGDDDHLAHGSHGDPGDHGDPGVVAAIGAGGERGCFTSVTCLGERHVRVRSCSAPPALLVGRAGAELVPSAPCSAGGAVIDDEHRLLVLSAAAYETLPRALVILLREFPSRFLRTDPVTLLETLFADIPIGSAALISPVLPSSPADRRPSKESS